MRRRRAQRCLARANAAIEAGSPAEAREALDEARQLGTDAGEIARLEELLDRRQQPSAPTRHLSWIYIAAAMGVAAVAAPFLAGPVLRQNAEPPAPTTTVSSFTPAAQPPVEKLPDVSSDSRSQGTAGSESPIAIAVQDVVPEPQTAAIEAPAPKVEEAPRRDEPPTAPPASASTGTNIIEAPQPAPLPSPPPESPPAIAASPPPAVVTAIPVQSTPVPVAPEPIAARETSTIPATPAPRMPAAAELAPTPLPVRDESAEVRTVLSSYERAYSALDSVQAQAIWPTVDASALSRAFSNLDSQQVSLGRCDVTLNGARARAVCAGSASWTPRVGGGGERSEARRWTFDLRKIGDAWRIERQSVVAR